jgi:hypothetical protein
METIIVYKPNTISPIDNNKSHVIPNQLILNIAALGAVLLLYTIVIIFCIGIESQVRAVLILIILGISSVYDIRENKVSLFACLEILSINILHTVFIYFDLAIWTLSFLVIAILFIFYSINKNLIGLGDILIITFCVQALIPEKVLGFLFTTFLLSSIVGLIKCMNVKNFRGISIPLTPCVTAAFIFSLLS